MKKSFLLVLLSPLLVMACMTVTAPLVSSTATSTLTFIPSETLTATSISTLTSTPIPVTPSETPTETPRPDVAPILPHTDVHFIYNGDRDKSFVALTFDLCQKPDYPAWFDQGIYDVLTRYNVPATFFVGGDWEHSKFVRKLRIN